MFEIRILQQDYDMKDPEGKTAFQHETAKKLAQFPEEMERNNYIGGSRGALPDGL